MTTRVRKVVTAIDANGSSFAEAHTETLAGERYYPNDPTTLDLAGPEADAWKADFNAATLAERDALKAERDALVIERDALLAEVEPVKDENAALKAEVEALKNPPWDVRTISPNGFLSRFTTPERRAIAKASQTDEVVVDIMAELQTVKVVRLDVQKTIDGVSYLAAMSLIAADRVPVLLADSTAEEV